MDPSTALSTSAQVAVAIAGFAGVVAAFRNESLHEWARIERFWLRLLLLNSIFPLAFSLLGLLLLAAPPALREPWRWCSAGAVLLLLPYAAMILKHLVGFARGELEAAGGAAATSYVLAGALVLVCALQLYNVVALASFWPFFCAIVALLLGAMYQFVRLVLTPRPGQKRS